MDLLSFGHHLAAQSPQRPTLSGEHDGRRVWVKKSVSSKTRHWHVLQKAVTFCLPFPVLRTTVSKGGAESLRQEAGRLREFKAKGIHVPDVLALDNDILVMSHLGPQLKEFLEKETDPEIRLSMLKKAVKALADMHRSGLAHGRPYLRDMTWDGERIGFLDFEENPTAVMSLEAAQARDIWLFLSSCGSFACVRGDKYTYDRNFIDALFNEYRQYARPETLKELQKFMALLKPFPVIIGKFLWRRVGGDVRRSAFVTDYLGQKLGS